MKLGLLSDIHEQVEYLRAALSRLETEQVDQVVVIGDLLETGERLGETCRLLARAGAIGVWGNHDLGLCVNPNRKLIRKYGDDVIAYMKTLRPRLTIADCHFTHVEPWLNPEDIMDLWYFEGPPDEHGKLGRIFRAVPHRIMFVGHYHKWLLAVQSRITGWCGDAPIYLKDQRFFVVIDALCQGCFATYDTETCELAPFRVE